MARNPHSDSGTADWQARASIWLVAASVLVWLPGGFTRFVLPKLLLIAVATLLAAWSRRTGRLPVPVLRTLAAGLGVFVLAALLGGTPVASLVGRWPRYEGVAVLLLYAAAAWIGSRVAGQHTRAGGELVRALSFLGLALAAFSLLEALGIDVLGRSGHGPRTGSVLGNAVDQGLVAMMLALVLIPVALESRDRLAWAAVAASLLTLALSGSRTAILITALGILVLALANLRRALLPAAMALGGLLGAVLVIPATRDRLLAGDTITGHWLQWRLTGQLIRDHPLFGVGPSRYADAFGGYETQRWVDFTGIRTHTDSPHNVVLQLWSAGGPLLLVAGVALAVLVVRFGWPAARSGALGSGLLVAVCGYAVALLAGFTIAGPTCLAAFLAGSLISEEAAGDEEPGWRRLAVAATAGAAAIALTLGCLSEIALQRGVTAVARGDLSAAQGHFDTARRLRPYDGDVAMLQAQALAEPAGRRDPDATPAAEEAARSSLRHTPHTYVSGLALGISLISQNRPKEAYKVLTTVIEHYPLRPDGYVQRAIARVGVGDNYGARTDLRRANEIAPSYKLARQLLKRLGKADSSHGPPETD